MKRIFKAVFHQPYTAKELATTIERHLIRPPFPRDWYDVAQSLKDSRGRGLVDGWRETLIIDEINEIASRLTWKTQRRRLVEYLLDFAKSVAFNKNMNQVKSAEAKDILLNEYLSNEFSVSAKAAFLNQEAMVRVVSGVVLRELGHRLYGFDEPLKLQLEYWEKLTDRFHSIKCSFCEVLVHADDVALFDEFTSQVLNPLLQEYCQIMELSSRQILSGDFDAAEMHERNMQVEYKIMEMREHLLPSSDLDAG